MFFIVLQQEDIFFREGKPDVSAENLQTAAKLTKNEMPISLVDKYLRLVSGTALSGYYLLLPFIVLLQLKMETCIFLATFYATTLLPF